MTIASKHLRTLFLFCLGLFVGTAYCMKWMESDFRYAEGPFTIIGLEISYPAEQIRAVMGGLDARVHTILGYHLAFDFAFMAGVYPGIAALCLLARQKTRKRFLLRLLGMMALGQLLAWGADVYENICLLGWLRDPASVGDLGFYHAIVWLKWSLALGGLIVSLPLVVRKTEKQSA